MTDAPKRVKIRLVAHDYNSPDNSRAEFFDDKKPEALEGIVGDDEWAELMGGVDAIYTPSFSCWPCLCCGGIVCCIPSCCQAWICVIPLMLFCMRRDNQQDRDVLRELDAFLKQESQNNAVFKDNGIVMSAKKSVANHEPVIEVVIGAEVADGGSADSTEQAEPSSKTNDDEGAAPAKSDDPDNEPSEGGLDDVDGSEDADENEGSDLDGLD